MPFYLCIMPVYGQGVLEGEDICHPRIMLIDNVFWFAQRVFCSQYRISTAGPHPARIKSFFVVAEQLFNVIPGNPLGCQD